MTSFSSVEHKSLVEREETGDIGDGGLEKEEEMRSRKVGQGQQTDERGELGSGKLEGTHSAACLFLHAKARADSYVHPQQLLQG